MALTYVALASVTVGSGGAANIEFTSIPQTYTDLQIVLSGRSTDAVFLRGVNLRFNGNSSSVYSYRQLYGGPTTGSYSETNITSMFIGQMPGTSATASTFSNVSLYVPNYTGSTNKSVSIDATEEINSSSNWQLDLVAGLWANTAAITSVALIPGSGNFAQHSTATLYGIKNTV